MAPAVTAVVAGALVGVLVLVGWMTQPWWSPVGRWLERWWPLPVAVALFCLAVLLLPRLSRAVQAEDAAAVGKPEQPEAVRALSLRAIVLGAMVLLGVGVVASVTLLHSFPAADATQKLDALRTAATFVAGTGGAAALLLAARRQRSTELTLAHQQQVAEITEHDAIERRVTELYTKAVEQLGSDKPVVRQGGLYALERVAQDNPAHRQTVINVLCAYLRAPYTPPPDQPAARRTGLPRSLRGTPATRVTAARRTRLTPPPQPPHLMTLPRNAKSGSPPNASSQPTYALYPTQTPATPPTRTTGTGTTPSTSLAPPSTTST
ncbi:hypothetical protein [Amycolatopsis magusensis]|uniref:hypothetical protein n=1 Tax=Amycolatopsis magusensis TaxID=882444 RepID=UPI0024A7F049|nr:hypothetical protein [Amycolatopsis magusensis]MDI5978236.1 hypothetical protein [Amycolatopsis magusensis]